MTSLEDRLKDVESQYQEVLQKENEVARLKEQLIGKATQLRELLEEAEEDDAGEGE